MPKSFSAILLNNCLQLVPTIKYNIKTFNPKNTTPEEICATIVAIDGLYISLTPCTENIGTTFKMNLTNFPT